MKQAALLPAAGLFLSGKLGVMQMLCNIAAQITGAILGAAFLHATIPNASESPLGANALADGVGIGNALCGEIVLTFVLVGALSGKAESATGIVGCGRLPCYAFGLGRFQRAMLQPLFICTGHSMWHMTWQPLLAKQAMHGRHSLVLAASQICHACCAGERGFRNG